MDRALNKAAPHSQTANAYAVQLRGLWLRLGRELILRGTNLDIAARESVTLLGPNGAGKTTLLRLLASALRPTRGEGRIFGFDLSDARSVREHIHLMPVGGGFYPDLSCRENLEFALKMSGKNNAPILQVLDRVGLAAASDRRVRFISAGMKKRLALACAALRRQPLTLVDEPFANLDAAGRELVLELLGELASDGSTLIIAAHEPELAQQIAPRTLWLEGGHLSEKN